jgi:hypothetical protein
MFSYYGSKVQISGRYTKPTHNKIIEPFAGSAGYALRYCGLDVTLVERDPVVAGVWRYLINVGESEFLRLPLVHRIDELPDSVPEEAKNLIGFLFNRGAESPRKSMSRWGREGSRPNSFWGEVKRGFIASNLHRIRHWEIIEGDYTNAPDVGATWFIDPPYAVRGSHYKFGSDLIDYDALSDWCRERQGQVMVCENEGADWLPFKPFTITHGGHRNHKISKSTAQSSLKPRLSGEVIWEKEEGV